MPLVSFSSGQVINSTNVNANFGLCMLTDTERTVTVTHTYTASQTFSGGIAVTGTITMATAASRIVPGATSLSLRNTANTADNLIITDVGIATHRGRHVAPGYSSTRALTVSVPNTTATTVLNLSQACAAYMVMVYCDDGGPGSGKGYIHVVFNGNLGTWSAVATATIAASVTALTVSTGGAIAVTQNSGGTLTFAAIALGLN